ncbi:MAG: hypothetical protein IKQ90_05660 [Ruminococcus sp.]|nr:hypothetical protein [Ruminococcus sp.]
MKIEEIFNDPENEMTDNIADNYSDLSDEVRERLYARIQQKLDVRSSGIRFTDHVSGVERYKRCIWKKALSVAASVLAVVGIGTAVICLNRNNNINKEPDNVLNSLDYADHPAIAKVLSEEFLAASDYLTGNIQVADNVRYFYDYSSRNPEWHGGDVGYYLIIDTAFSDCNDLYSTLDSSVTSGYMDILKRDGGTYFNKSIDELLSGNGSDHAPAIVEYSGKMYTSAVNRDASDDKNSEPEITDNEKYDFSAVIDAGKSYVFDFSWDGEQWRISDIELV